MLFVGVSKIYVWAFDRGAKPVNTTNLDDATNENIFCTVMTIHTSVTIGLRRTTRRRIGVCHLYNNAVAVGATR